METAYILTAYNEERRICFGTIEEVDRYLSLLNSTRDVNYWEKEPIEVMSENEEALSFSFFEAITEMEEFDV